MWVSLAFNFGDFAVAHGDHNVGDGRGLSAVRGHQRSSIFFASQAEQEFENFRTGGVVEIPRRFIGEQHFGGMHQRASDGDALHLPAGKLMRHAVLEAGEVDGGQAIYGDLAS